MTTSAPSRPRRRWLPIALILLVVTGIALAGGVVLMQQVAQVRTNIDDILITDEQQALIDEVAVMSSCTGLRAALGAAQEILADEESLGHAFARRLASTAESQLDRMRCGG